ncbi:uncharacterized protein LOC143375962 [Andrena cerasifolii]|uniref:uncharacterized protein LOC143375962 n=1 Tax=Andrena cerasifolii TaxID=2819439 RepID=UPI0040378D5C
MLRPLKVIKYLYYANNQLVRGNSIEIGQNACNNLAQRQAISSSAICKSNLQAEEEQKKKKKTPRIPRITLIHPDESVTIVLLDEAQKLAKRRNLQLEKMPYIDTKSDRDVYKLYSNADAISENIEKHSEETSKNCTVKSTKLFPIQSRISDHDLDVKITNVNKLLTKRHRIKLLISFSLEEKERLLQHVKRKVQGVLSEERLKQNSVILIYVPLLDSECSNSKENIGNTKSS